MWELLPFCFYAALQVYRRLLLVMVWVMWLEMRSYHCRPCHQGLFACKGWTASVRMAVAVQPYAMTAIGGFKIEQTKSVAHMWWRGQVRWL